MDPAAPPLPLAARGTLLLGVRPKDERALPEPFALLRGLTAYVLINWWQEASLAVAETGVHAPSRDVYRAAARLYGRIRAAFDAACAGEHRRLVEFERQWRARGHDVHAALQNWRERWVDTGVCTVEGSVAAQKLLPPQPPGTLTDAAANGAPTPRLDLQWGGVAPAALTVHLDCRSLPWGQEPHACWGYTIRLQAPPAATRTVLDRQGRERDRLGALLAGLADAALCATAWARPGNGTAVILTSPDRDALRLAAGTWDAGERSLGAYMRRPTDECRALAALARRAYERLDALRRDSPVFMRDSAAGVERDRAVALAWRAPRPLDLPGVSDIERIPGLLYGGRTDDDAGEHGFGRCCVCTEDFRDVVPIPAPQGGLPAAGSPRPPGSFAWPCAHSLCYDCDGHHSMTRCPLCQRARRT